MDLVKSVEVTEDKKAGIDNYHNIKPETDINAEKAKSFIEEKFNSNEKSNTEEKSKQYFDDKGKLYREGNELMPDTEYSINGYEYTTDGKGRIASVEGKLHMKEHDKKLKIKDSIHDIGKGDEKSTDDRGHLIGDQFGGSNGLENLIPQDSKINQHEFKQFENQLATEVKAGKDVRVKIQPVYKNGSHRPDSLSVSYSINGQKSVRIFSN